jgi:hypothetical protein
MCRCCRMCGFRHQIYAEVCVPLVAAMFRGGRSTCFAYGQTGENDEMIIDLVLHCLGPEGRAVGGHWEIIIIPLLLFLLPMLRVGACVGCAGSGKTFTMMASSVSSSPSLSSLSSFTDLRAWPCRLCRVCRERQDVHNDGVGQADGHRGAVRRPVRARRGGHLPHTQQRVRCA